MRLYIQEKENLIKINLPAKVDGSLLFSYKSTSTGKENQINIDSANNQWVLKSNGNINIVGNHGIIPEIVLTDYMCIPVTTEENQGYICFFCLPSIENNSSKYNLSNIEKISIGSDDNNNIVYKQNLMKPQHAIIQKSNNVWYICPVDNADVYVNDKFVIGNYSLSVGDVIFINGIRIIWMNKFIEIPINKKLFTVKNINPITEELTISNQEYDKDDNIDDSIELYNEEEYFSRVPRITNVIEEKEIQIEPPPPKQVSDQEMPFILSIGSSITMIGMMSMYGFNIYNGVQSNKPLTTLLPQIIMCCTMLVGSMILPIITKRWTKKNQQKREQKRQEKYSEYLQKKEFDIELTIKKQIQILLENNKDIINCKNIIETRNRYLWCREIKDDDFLSVRLGIGTRPSFININAPEEGFSLDDDNLYSMVCNTKEKYKMLSNVPITIDLKEQIVTALIMSSSFNEDFINGLLLQLVTCQSPDDLKIIVMTDKANESKWDYIRYLPHCWSDDKKIRFFGTNQDDLKNICQTLEEEYNLRKERKSEKEKETKETTKDKVEEYALYDTYYLIITDNFKMIKDFKFISNLLENQYNYGFSMLAIEKTMKNLPKESQKFIAINDTESGIFSSKIKEAEMIKFKAEYEHNLNMREMSRKIANIPIHEKGVEHQLPAILPFLQMYNVGKIEQLNIMNRWLTSDPITTLQAPVGVHQNGELFMLDLHEKFDGPHGLIAGSTGSGKSEFIITYILSMALNYDPKEVQFVLIDYKGGGLAGAFENREQNISIPHLAGTITNLDTAEMNRTLVSIESELKRRQVKFNEARQHTGESTMDIYKYQRLYREGLIEEPISHLFIISDEFAELKSQQPEFMQQLISTARIGRSLGVHLVLATQKPSGVVNDQIWSNSKFKVCLKVQSRADSMEMLKRPEAASIKETGRFYLQVGYDEYFDIGQSAWSGEKYRPTERIVKKIDTSIVFIDNCGKVIKQSSDMSKKTQNDKDNGDQLTNIVRYLKQIVEREGFKPKKLWLPALAKEIILKDLIQKYSYTTKALELKPIVGEYDAPETQTQGLLTLDLLNNGNVLVYGIPGSGKENVLISMVYSLSLYHSPEEINIYIGDFGAETLKMLSKFPQVGDVFITEEENKLDNLLKMLDKEIERRKKEYSEYGGNYLEYCKLSQKLDPALIIILNNYENFIESYPRKQEIFNSFIRDGLKYGIVFIITTAVSTAIRSRVSQNFFNKICLKMPNDYDYRDLLGAKRGQIPTDANGRGIVTEDGDYCYEFQTAIICDRESRTQFLKTTAEELKVKYPSQNAKKIPVLPNIAYVDDVIHELKGLEFVPIGIEINSLEVYVYNFIENKINLIAANSINNHIYFVYALIKQFSMLKNVKLHVIDALSIYKGNYANVDIYKENIEEGFIKAYKSVQTDKELKEKHIYMVLGIEEFKNKMSTKYQEHITKLFNQANNCENNIFIFLDDSENYKKLQLEDWYRENINSTFGIWLGEDIAVQMSLGVMSLTLEDKQLQFPCIGYPIYQGHHMTVKYVVDGVDRVDE